MDLNRFDDLTRTVTSLPSRRGMLGGLATALFATLPLVLSGEDVAAKKKKRKRKKKKRNQPPPPPGCTPQCDGRTCGDDGCEGTCGSCGNNEICDSGTCICIPDCAPSNACGADGCGGSCGTCAPNPTCQGTQVTVTECRGGVCTPVTTNCGAGQVCFQNACCTKNTPPTCRKQPVSDGCGGTFPANCGANQFCCDGPDGDLICQATPCP
jgi:hypothetical protein